MSFAHPVWLAAALPALLVMVWTWARHDARQRRALAELVSTHLSAELTRSMSVGRRRLKRVLFAAAVALLFAALAEPRLGFRWVETERRGNDVLFAVDTSRSMLTPDVKPDRLARAKLAIDDFVGRLDGDAVGLVAFAGSAFVQCPLTLDYGAFQESLAALDTRTIPHGGTDIASAIRAAEAALQNRPGSDKVLILLTDGEDLQGNALEAAKSAATAQRLKIYTVGVGTPAGDLIPLPEDQGGGFLQDDQGRFVRSRLDEAALRAIAQATGGAYAPLGAANQGLDQIYREAIAPQPKHALAARRDKIYIERFQWPLAASLGLLLSSLLIGTRRRARAFGSAPAGARLAAILVALAALLPLRPVEASVAGTAASDYRQGDFAKAQREYSAAADRNPSEPVLRFDAGTAAYKAGDYPAATREFQAALGAARSGSAQRLAEQQDTYYNLGNTLYRAGQKTESSDPSRTIDSWRRAIKAYEAALQLRADDADSKFNRDLVNRKLEELEKRQKNRNNSAHSAQSNADSQGQSQGQSQAQSQARQAGGSGQPQPASPQQQSAQQQSAQQQSPQPQTAQQQSAQGQSAPEPPKAAATSAAGPPSTARNPSGAGAQDGDAGRIPGQMTPEEARELLDSVKDEERRAPSAQNSAAQTSIAQPSKDW